MNNDKLNKKISEIKLEIEDLVQKINDEKVEDDSTLDYSLENEKLIKEENLVINSSLDFLDQENQKLFIKIEALKNEVNESLNKLASNNTFFDIIEKFIKIYGEEKIDKEKLNKFFNIENKYVNESVFLSNSEISNLSQKAKNENIALNKVQELFKKEVEKIEKINSNKEIFAKENVSINSVTDEQKLFDIFSKIDNEKLNFFKNINDVSFSELNSEIDLKELNKLLNNYQEIITTSYENLKNEFTKMVS